MLNFVLVRIFADGKLRVGVTLAPAVNPRVNSVDDVISSGDGVINSGSDVTDNTSGPPRDEMNLNSNNGNDLPENLPTPTICVYGSNGMAGPLDLDISQNSALVDESHCECNVRSHSAVILLMFVVFRHSLLICKSDLPYKPLLYFLLLNFVSKQCYY